jgi:hypothetical protein
MRNGDLETVIHERLKIREYINLPLPVKIDVDAPECRHPGDYEVKQRLVRHITAIGYDQFLQCGAEAWVIWGHTQCCQRVVIEGCHNHAGRLPHGNQVPNMQTL